METLRIEPSDGTGDGWTALGTNGKPVLRIRRRRSSQCEIHIDFTNFQENANTDSSLSGAVLGIVEAVGQLERHVIAEGVRNVLRKRRQ